MNCLQLPEFLKLVARLRSARSRWRTIETIQSSAAFLGLTAGLLLAALLLDRCLHGGPAALIATEAALLLAWVALFAWTTVRPLLRPLRDEKVAIHVEERLGNLEGRLINTLQIARDRQLSQNPFSPIVVLENCRALEKTDFTVTLPWRAVQPAVLGCLAAIGLVALYGYASPDRFLNSLQRYLAPTRSIDAITNTRIESVDPGNLVVLGGTDVTVRTRLSGQPPERLLLRVGAQGNWRDIARARTGTDGRFEWTLPHLTRALDYQVLAGDDRSEIFHIELTESPTLQSLDVTLVYPEYLKRATESLENHGGNLEVVEGTSVRIRAHANKPLQSAELHRTRHEPATLSIESGQAADDVVAEFTVTETESYWFTLVDRTGNPSVAPVQHAIVAVKDQPPSVQLVSPAEDMPVAASDGVGLQFAATDDFGLARADLKLDVTRAFDRSMADLPGQSLPLAELPLRHTGEFLLQLAALKLADGDVLRCCIELQDSLGQRSASATRTLTVVRPSQGSQADRAAQLTDLDQLKRLLSRQQANLASTDGVAALVGTGPIREDLDGITAEQMGIRDEGGRLAAGLSEKLGPVKNSLRQLAQEELADSVAALDDAGRASQASSQRRHLLEAKLLEEETVKKLEQMIAQGAAASEASEKARQSPEATKPDAEKLKDETKALEAFKEKLTHFYKEQKANVLETQKLLELPPDSAEAEALARKILERQRLAEKLAREAKDQTKVLAEEKITNEHLIDLMEDVYRAVSDAVKKGEAKEFRNMLMKEEMAVLMADSIPDNGEAFLTNSLGSKTKWDFEDWPEEERPETKLPPIPPNMHDTLGDLLDAQEDLAEDADDMNSQMHFGATDNTGLIGGDGGPASNWMAKGRSGNTKPKNNEVGGRSGSGRTGKTSGEFVDAADVAKEGRETEDRYTKEQAMEGFVPTKGEKKRAGGSTSTGGKRSDEATEFGLRGDAPINWSHQRMKLKEKQDDLRLKTELFVNKLKEITGQPDFDANSALLLMQEVQSDLDGGRFDHAVRKQIEASLHLKKLRRRLAAYVGQTEASSGERSGNAAPAQHDDPLLEKYPDEYRKLLQEYYKVLAEGAGE
ncbi:MAG: DUF4175 family protein [Planctomycetes bacterium]|nr:DUF4175 family protein [Planctomycetota bacterium]